MTFNGVIIRKLEMLDSILAEIQAIGPVGVKKLQQDLVIRRAVERLLQIAIEIVVDVCQRILSLRGETPATSAAGAIERCVHLGIIRPSGVYRKMVGFRNVLVHDYAVIDLKIVSDVVTSGLQVFGDFRDDVILYAKD